MNNRLDSLREGSDKILRIALNGKQNYIFGKGWMASKLYEAFKFLGVQVEGFVVSSKISNSELHFNLPVYEKAEIGEQFLGDNIFIALRDQEKALTEEMSLLFKNVYEITYPKELTIIAARYYIDKLDEITDLTNETISIGDVKLPNPFFKEFDYLLSWVYEAGDLIFPVLLDNYERIDEGPYENQNVGLEEGDVVFDCGANIGLFSAIAAKKKCKAYAFEPVPEIREYLNDLRENLYPSIQMCPFALSDEVGETIFHIQKNDLLGASMFGNNNVNDKEITVDVTTIDEFVKNNNIQRVDFIKADIEGAERYMLKGAKETIKKWKPKISICTYHLEDDKEILEDIIRGIEPRYVVEHKFKKLYAYFPETRYKGEREMIDNFLEESYGFNSYMEFVKEKVAQRKNICIFPLGIAAKATFLKLKSLGIEADFFCDNDSKKVGQIFFNKQCISVDELLLKHKEDTTVIIESLYYMEIKERLLEKGILNILRIYPNKFEIDRYLNDNKNNIQVNVAILNEILEDSESKKIVSQIVGAWSMFDIKDDYFANIFSLNQYFDKEILHLTENEVFVDCGAYTGDTALKFLEAVSYKFDKMHLFELDRQICNTLEKNIATYNLTGDYLKNIHCYPVGVSDNECEIEYSSGDSNSNISSQGDCKGKVVRLDEILQDENVTFIKMDIEGAEYAALHGAEALIKKQKPKLAICIYHSAEDLFRIPLYLRELVPEYKIYIRHYTDMFYETVCYATL